MILSYGTTGVVARGNYNDGIWNLAFVSDSFRYFQGESDTFREFQILSGSFSYFQTDYPNILRHFTPSWIPSPNTVFRLIRFPSRSKHFTARESSWVHA